MSSVFIEPDPRAYKFEVAGYKFLVTVAPKDTTGVHPTDILIDELEQCLVSLRQMGRFKIVSGQKTAPMEFLPPPNKGVDNSPNP